MPSPARSEFYGEMDYESSAHSDLEIEEGIAEPLLADPDKLQLVPRRTRRAQRAPFTIFQNDVPMFMRRHCVIAHYRPQSRFIFACMSIFRIHNETVNIWSHIIGAVLMWVLALCFSLSILRPADIYSILAHGHVTNNAVSLKNSDVSLWPLIVFDIASSVTFLLSAAAHTFSCLSYRTSSLFWTLDQVGITLGIFSMYIPGAKYLLYEYPAQVGNRYLLGISIVSVVCATLGIGFSSKWIMKKYIRLMLYSILTLCCILPLTQVWVEKGDGQIYKNAVLRYAGCVLVAAFGGFVYSVGAPEVLAPGKFDLFGASHQLFHISVVVCFVMFHAVNIMLWISLSQRHHNL